MANKHPLRPFVKGDPRINRNGRPKSGETMADLIHQFFKEDIVVEAAKGKSKREVRMLRKRLFIEAVYNRAVRESDAAARLLLNYHDGLPPFRGTISTDDGDEDGFDPSQLSDGDLATLVAIYRKGRVAGNVAREHAAVGGNGKNGAGKNGKKKSP